MFQYISIAFIIDWTIRLVALFYVPRNRKPVFATDWQAETGKHLLSRENLKICIETTKAGDSKAQELPD